MMRIARSGRALIASLLILLMTWLAMWLGVLVDASPTLRGLWLSLALIPLLLVAAGVWFNLKGAYAWCGFVSLGYLAQGIAVAWTGDAHAWAGAVEIFLSMLLFAAASGALRARRSQH
ncbi:MAG TPA: DUF2069 domain-containing protein [Gammaproteobacteria bacterium]|nr:DUF2069 domain-containing protein [Gammaproteobacteria bacterium]